MNEQNIVVSEDVSSDSESSNEVISESIENSQISVESNLPDVEQSEDQEEEDSNEQIDNITESGSSVYQVKEDSESETGYSVVGLDVDSLNQMVQGYNEVLTAQTVTPTTNDYYAFIDGDILEYFQGVMANKPLNEYRACHLRHWIQNTQYYSYYDDYYYLWYDYGNSLDYIEIVKYNGQANYIVSNGSGSVLNASIMYGSDDGLSDLRRGVSYVQEMALLCSVAIVLVLYIVRAIFKHLCS